MYKVNNEIFYSVQGEGARAGTPNVFIRLAGCDLACTFCDTEFESSQNITAEAIAARVLNLAPKGPRSVILTGGEPLLQYNQELHAALRSVGVALVAIETNGSSKPKAPVDWVSCSPKVAEHVVAANYPDGVQELRYVRHPGQGIPNPTVKSDHLYLSPEFKGNVLQRASLAYCIELVKANPMWSLSVQQQKIWGVR